MLQVSPASFPSSPASLSSPLSAQKLFLANVLYSNAKAKDPTHIGQYLHGYSKTVLLRRRIRRIGNSDFVLVVIEKWENGSDGLFSRKRWLRAVTRFSGSTGKTSRYLK